MISLWKKSVNVFTMGNPVADNQFLLFIYRHTNPVVPNANLVFIRMPFHLLKIAEIKRIVTYEIIKNDFLSLLLDTFRKLGKFL